MVPKLKFWYRMIDDCLLFPKVPLLIMYMDTLETTYFHLLQISSSKTGLFLCDEIEYLFVNFRHLLSWRNSSGHFTVF